MMAMTVTDNDESSGGDGVVEEAAIPEVEGDDDVDAAENMDR